MIPGSKFARIMGIVLLSAAAVAVTSQTHSTHKSKKKQPPIHPLPSGPTGPIQQIPLDSMAPVAPRVTYENGQLTIVAANSTLGDILKAVRKQTGADIDVPDAKERVVTHLGPAPAQEVIADLLNGSRFNYVLLGSPQNPAVLTKVVLVARSGPDNASRPIPPQAVAAAQPPTPEAPADAGGNEAEAVPEENSADENPPDQAAADNGDQTPGQPDSNTPPGVKTPQELLQEMQQRQLQMQQGQTGSPGNPPGPGAAIPQGPAQER